MMINQSHLVIRLSMGIMGLPALKKAAESQKRRGRYRDRIRNRSCWPATLQKPTATAIAIATSIPNPMIAIQRKHDLYMRRKVRSWYMGDCVWVEVGSPVRSKNPRCS
jgi:hypothetical protein